MNSRFRYNKHGAGMLLFIIVFGSAAFSIIIFGVSGYAIFEHQASVRKHVRDEAFHVAEAGINYYRWHLAHAPNDYMDGNTSTPGPYVHAYEDKDGTVVGYFSLDITPPESGTNVVSIASTGWTVSKPDIRRTILVRLGYRGIADYAFVENGNMSFSETTEVHGKIHANGGIEFNGTTDAPVQSAVETYEINDVEYEGVWGIGGPTDFWEYPVTPIDFNSVTADLAALESLAEDEGLHLSSSGDEGYYIEFQEDGTFDLYEVDSVYCYYGDPYQYYIWYVWSTLCYDLRNTTYVDTYTIDTTPVVYVEDDVWVAGTVNGRVTIAAAEFPETPSNYKRIFIQDNLVYAEKAGDDILGLIAQGEIIVPKNVPNDMEIHAAALSQYEQIRKPYYSTGYGDSIRNSLLFFGSQISFKGGGWKYINGSGNVVNGFVNTNHTYDGNLLYLPPIGFPVEDTYELISWEEVE